MKIGTSVPRDVWWAEYSELAELARSNGEVCVGHEDDITAAEYDRLEMWGLSDGLEVYLRGSYVYLGVA